MAQDHTRRLVVAALCILCVASCVTVQREDAPMAIAHEDLSLTESPEHPGYYLISEADLDRVMNRMLRAEERVRIMYEEHGVAIPD